MPEISIDLNGVLKLLSNLKPDKAAGPDEIKPVVLKELRHEIAHTLSADWTVSVYRNSSKWLDQNLGCPLFKKGDKGNPVNYRPISLTCILYKVMEHIIASNLAKHFNKSCMSCSMFSVRSAHVKLSSYSLLRICLDNLLKVLVNRLTLSFWTLAKLLRRSTTWNYFLTFSTWHQG